jgi:hypothetical protein
MAARLVILSLGVVLICAFGTVIIGEQQRSGRLQTEAARLEHVRADCIRFDHENGRWQTALAEAGDPNSLRDRCAEVERMRAEIDTLDLQQRSLKRALGLRDEAVWPMGAVVRREREWKFRGQASPADSVESVLWSARSGDVDHLSNLISFEPNAKQKADEIFAGLPEGARAQYGNAETIIATFVAAQMPTDYSAMAAIRQTELSPDSTLLTLRIEDGSGTQRDLTVKLQRERDTWRLDVPEAVVSLYAVQLEGSPNLKSAPGSP